MSPGNDVNGFDLDADGDGFCREAHTLELPDVTALQEAYVRHVVDTVGSFDNVLYEISNESPGGSADWHQHMIDLIRSTESDREFQHPIGMTAEWPDGQNDTLFASTADWISPNADGGYQTDSPVAPGGKVVVLDTDHLWGVGGDGDWVWRAVTRGYDVAFMDRYDDADPGYDGSDTDPDRRLAIRAMRQARRVAASVDLGEARTADQRVAVSAPFDGDSVLVVHGSRGMTVWLPVRRSDEAPPSFIVPCARPIGTG